MKELVFLLLVGEALAFYRPTSDSVGNDCSTRDYAIVAKSSRGCNQLEGSAGASGSPKTWQQCGEKCNENPNCTAWKFNPSYPWCWNMGGDCTISDNKITQNDKTVGLRGCPTSVVAPLGGDGSCGGTLNGSTGASGTITSPGYPEGYANDLDCTWNISPAGGNKVVKFTVEDLELSNGWDYLEFLEADGNLDDVAQITQTCWQNRLSTGCNTERCRQSQRRSDCCSGCGATIPPVFTRGNGQGATVKFHSDDSETKKGFKIKYEIVENPSCQGVKMYTAVGEPPAVLTSPGYPNNYPINSRCDWTITVPAGQKVKLVFEKFNTKADDFWADQIFVYNGGDNMGYMLDTVSGSTIPEQIKSDGNQLHIRFSSYRDTTEEDIRFKAIASAEN